MSLNIAWGSIYDNSVSRNGFMDLSGDATGGAIHGPTASGGEASFFEDAGIQPNLVLDTQPNSAWNPSASMGRFQGQVTFTDAQEADLLAGKFYVNIRTAANPNGEIRGNLVQHVPEPATGALLALGVGMLTLQRRRTS